MGALVLDVEGLQPTREEQALLSDPRVAGVVLFARNCSNPEQLHTLCTALRDIRAGLILMVDQEGGRVQRCTDGFTRLPPAAAFGACHDRDPQAALQLAQEAGWLMAWELRSAGLDISLAPVLDVAGPEDSCIGDRAYHADPATVARLAIAWMHGARRAGMAAVGKHYPGHGLASGDTHTQRCVDTRPAVALAAHDLIPFTAAIAAGIEGIMLGHVCYPAVAQQPASLSATWIQRWLRVQHGYRGLVLSDDLNMAAAAAHIPALPARVQTAWRAGCELALCCNLGSGRAALLAALRDSSPLPARTTRPLQCRPGTAPDATAIRKRLQPLLQHSSASLARP